MSVNPRLKILAALGAVYFIWGSTYLALRFGLEGFPPFLLNGFRFIVAGTLMYGFLLIRGASHPTGRQWWNAAQMAMLLLVGGVGLMTVAEDIGVGSGVAATAAAAIPVWTAIAAGVLGRWPSGREWVGLAVGLAGVVILLQEGDFQSSPLGVVLVIVAPLLWSIGSARASKQEMPDGLMAPAAQLLVAGVAMLAIGPLRGESFTATPNTTSVVALIYLIVMGSIVAYTAYYFLLKTVRPTLATSYAYVNPVVAVALGLTLGAEIITGPIFVALPMILAGVGLLASKPDQQRQRDSMPARAIEEAA